MLVEEEPLRSKRREQEREIDKQVGVALTPVKLQEYAEVLAGKVIYVDTLRKKRREDLRSINAEIESNLDEVGRLARVITAHEENVAQGDLFIGQTRETKEQAQRALAGVAKVAGLPAGRGRGRGSPAGLPSEPHPFGGAESDQVCNFCGSDRTDGVHADEMPSVDEAPPMVRDHQFVEALRENVSDVASCVTCGGTIPRVAGGAAIRAPPLRWSRERPGM